MTERVPGLPGLVIFDLDGTLVDTVPDIAVALNAALADLQLPPVSEEQARCWVGNGTRVLCGRAIARSFQDTADPGAAGALHERFLRRYAERACNASRVYPGVNEALDGLAEQEISLACVTNKPLEHTEILLDALGLRNYFALVLAGDSLPRKKPDPLPLQECVRRFSVTPEETWMVGDSDNDIAAAHAAGVASICVTYGYSQGRGVHELGADIVLDTLADLPQRIGDHGGGKTKRSRA